MANTFTVVRSWAETGVAGKNRVGKIVTVVMDGTGLGTAASPITAADVGLTKLESCGNVYDVTGAQVYTAAVMNDGSGIAIAGPEGAEATHCTPALLASVTAQFEVHGY